VKVYIDCTGCEQRKLDAQKVINYLHANGVDIVDSPEDCDYAIIITCAVDSRNEHESLSRLDYIAKNLLPYARIIIGGCLPSISPGKLTKYHPLVTFSPRNLDNLDALFYQTTPMREIPHPNKSVFDQHVEEDSIMSARDEYEMAKRGFKVRISEGCLGNCSYCMIKRATGNLKSESPDDVLKQVEEGITRGEKTIMLVGGDTGAYGADIGIGFYDLLRDIISIPGDYWIFIHDFNVNWLIKDIEKYLDVFGSENGRRIRCANFPLQSGSDRILSLMRRPYKSKDAINALKLTRREAPHLNQGTHVMIGFPSETEEDFSRTMEMLEDVEFDFITCFPYSDHPMAESYAIEGKISPKIVTDRLRKVVLRFGDRVKIMR